MELRRFDGWSTKVFIGGDLRAIRHRSMRWSLARPCLEISLAPIRWVQHDPPTLVQQASHPRWASFREERAWRGGSFTRALRWQKRGSISDWQDLLACRRESLGAAASAKARFFSPNPKRATPSFPYPVCNQRWIAQLRDLLFWIRTDFHLHHCEVLKKMLKNDGNGLWNHELL